MFKFFLILIFIPKQDYCLETFNRELGKQKAKVLTEIVNQFEENINKYEGLNLADKYRSFLQSIIDGRFEGYSIGYDRKIKTRKLIKSVGLDTAIFEYVKRRDDKGNERILLSKYVYSEYMNSLSAVDECDTLISEYVDAIKQVGDISPLLIAEGAKKNFNDEDYSNPIIKRILTVEFFIDQFLSDKLMN